MYLANVSNLLNANINKHKKIFYQLYLKYPRYLFTEQYETNSSFCVKIMHERVEIVQAVES